MIHNFMIHKLSYTTLDAKFDEWKIYFKVFCCFFNFLIQKKFDTFLIVTDCNTVLHTLYCLPMP